MKRRIILPILAVLTAFGLSGCGANPSSQNDDGASTRQKKKTEHASVVASAGWTVEPFRFTDENGHPFGMSDLKGKVWLADMIFTNCTTMCPPMTANLSKIQSYLKKQNIEAQFVSFSIDPKRDTRKALKTFGKKFDADFSTWHFLTGYTSKRIKDLSRKSFHSALSRIANTDQFTHSTSFFLVNQFGKIMVKYDGLEPPKKTIAKDVKALLDSDGASVSTTGQMKMDMKMTSSVENPLNVQIKWNPQSVHSGKKVILKVIITQKGKAVDDADEVMFEIWKKEDGGKNHHMIKAKAQGKGIYAVQHIFKTPGTYNVMSHVTTHGQHTMPMATIKVSS